MKKIFTLLTVALISTAALAQSTWKVDKAHSRLQFNITHLLVSDVDGRFKDFDATIVATKTDFSDAKVTLVAQTASVDTDNERRDTHLKSADFFDVTKNPTMNFTSTGITPAGAGKYKLTGNLTLNGVTKPVTLDFWHRGTIPGSGNKKDNAGFKVTGSIKRSDFNFGKTFGAATLSDEVQIIANGEFAKAS